ncbi:SMI1/KNR4 family protein [Hymenobacter aerophilus]|uniref:SMI1/KNR4 family protein n=1 Tax=Hymenobacter aerophilus TaxID=119644 RepID=UPI0003726F17|nr:SMI1/KNR4 family protein [Hymenobacter aerophilus]
MTLQSALAEIGQLWPGKHPFGFGHGGAAARLGAEFNQPLPPDLVDYLNRVAPAEDVYFDTVGNPLELYGLPRLGAHQDGYSWNSVAQQPIPDWNPDFFLLGDEGADPVLLDLGHSEAGIQRLRHGAGDWQTGDTMADTLGQFLLCAAARHHALNAFEADPFVDDDKGFSLAPRAAEWLFPRLRRWAGPHYAAWVEDFDNA